jgi:hypothetical protein
MLNFLECSEGSILEVTANGELTRADHVAFLARIEGLFKKQGKVHVLWEMKDFRGWESSADWDDPSFSLRYKDELKRLALVGPDKDRTWLARIAEPFGNVRYFRPVEREEAWNWVTEGVDKDLEQACIRRLAYLKWEAAGRPPGDGVPFWLEAERELSGPATTAA